MKLKNHLDAKKFDITPKLSCAFRGHSKFWVLDNGFICGSLDMSAATMECEMDRDRRLIPVLFDIEGEEALSSEGRDYALTPGQIMVHNAGIGEKFTINASERRMLAAYVPRSLLSRTFPYIDEKALAGVHVMNAGEDGVFLFQSLRYLIRKVEQANGQLTGAVNAALDAFNHLLTATLYTLPAAADVTAQTRLQHKKRIREYVLQNLPASLTVKAIARWIGLSESYVYSLFSDERESLMKWVWQLRLEKCRLDLQSPVLKTRRISDVAYSWGFSDTAHFSRLFHKHYGMSPSGYRQEMMRQVAVGDLRGGTTHFN